MEKANNGNTASSSEYYDEEETIASTVVIKKAKSKKIAIDISDASTAEALMKEVIKANPDKYKKTMDKKYSNIRYVYCNAPDEDLIDILS